MCLGLILERTCLGFSVGPKWWYRLPQARVATQKGLKVAMHGTIVPPGGVTATMEALEQSCHRHWRMQPEPPYFNQLQSHYFVGKNGMLHPWCQLNTWTIMVVGLWEKATTERKVSHQLNASKFFSQMIVVRLFLQWFIANTISFGNDC